MVAIHGHDDGAFKFIDDGFLEFSSLRHVIVVALALLAEALNLIVNQLKAIVNGQILADIVDDEVKATLENPGRGEETRPGLDGSIESLGF
jgi:hypothetical protein